MSDQLSISPDKVLIVAGPTASGKSSLVYRLIGNQKAVVVTIDSKHLYQGLSITSGWDLPSDKPNITHFGFGIVPVNGSINAVDYAHSVHGLIRQNLGITPIVLVGGSGFYLRAILETSLFSNTLVNQTLRDQLLELSLNQLQEMLFDSDPQSFLSLNDSDIKNKARLVRRLELASNPSHQNLPKYNFPHSLFCLPSPANHQHLIRQRVLDRLEQGSLNEVNNLLSKQLSPESPILKTIGVEQIKSYLNGEIDWGQMVETWTKAEFDYSKRQLTWFKKPTGVIWYDQIKHEDTSP